MSTHAQVTANQQNAARSTGPRTPEGKAVSARNATRHGLTSGFRILPSEDPEAYHQLLADYQDYPEYRAILRNEADPALPVTSEFRPVEPPVSYSPKCYDAEDVRSGSRCA